MKTTEKLFYLDTYQKEAKATVLSCEATKGLYEVILDKTIFYPLGGGQPGDTGYINEYRVVDTREKSEVVIHYVDSANCTLQNGDKVSLQIDWERRFELMQNHSVEHIVTGIANELYGYENIGFNLSEDLTTIDLSGELTERQVQDLENRVNQAIITGTNIDISYPSGEQLKQLDYRSKKALDGDVRIVTIGDLDTCACCGLHCTNLSEVGLFKVISYKKNKSGIRLMCLAGKRAFRDYQYKHDKFQKLSQMLSLKTKDTYDAIVNMHKENQLLKSQLNLVKAQLYKIEIDTLKPKDTMVICKQDLTTNDIKNIANILLEKCNTACIFSINGSEIKYYITTNGEKDLRVLNKILLEQFDGRGGGSKTLVQGLLNNEKKDILMQIETLVNNI